MLLESSSSDEELLFLWSSAASKKKRKYWVHPINTTREEQGEFSNIFLDLLKDEQRFYNYFRMSINSFNELYNIIKSDIEKQNTNWRKCVSSKERLVIFLRFLATRDTFKTIGHLYRMGSTTVGKIVKEVSKVIWKTLQPLYMAEPTEKAWQEVEAGFNEKWRFPNCIGSIDGKHVYIKCPPNTRTLHFGYRQRFSIVLLAVVDPDYKFILIDVGTYGKDSDSTVFQSTSFYQKIVNNQLNIPGPKPLPGREKPVPHVLIGDGGFILETFLLRPFPTSVTIQDERKRTYNKRLSSARRVVESTFGILPQKWRVFLKPLELNADTVVDIVKAACCLHNYLRVKGDCHVYDDEPDINNDQRSTAFQPFQQTNKNRTNCTAYAIQDEYVTYFNQ